MFLTGSILILQLMNLQLLWGNENRLLAKKFVSHQVFTVAPRGLIYDRSLSEDRLLVKNTNYINFVIYPSHFRNRKEGLEFIRKFCLIMGRSFEDFREKVTLKNWRNLARKNRTLILVERLTQKEHERVMAFQMLASRGEFETHHLRYYTMGPALAHITGYVGLPSRRDLERKMVQPYQFIGKGGLESRYDSELRGTDGIRIRHRIINSEEQIADSEHGNHMALTIDRNVQAAAYRALSRSGKRGAAVAMRTTGEILAMVSLPSFDPNILSNGTGGRRTRHFKQIQKYGGFLNLSIQTKFPPASTFKPIVALAALESGGTTGISEHTSFFCPGKWRLDSTVPGLPASEYKCWLHSGHARNGLIDAIAKSCNVYFYQLGYKLGPTPIIQLAKSFGLNSKTNVDLPGEISGFVPDQLWKQRHWSSRWYDGDTVNLAVGQGFLEVTPLALAVLYAALNNEGKIYRPFLLQEVLDPVTNRVLRRVRPELVQVVPLAAKNLGIVQEGLRKVVLEGTARGLNRKGMVAIAGKTGTAETGQKVTEKDHAWFVGYAPFDAAPEERVVVVVFIEHGRGGAAAAAPVAGEIFQTLFPERSLVLPAPRIKKGR